MAHTVILPTLAHSSSNCWWYFLANLMNLHLPTSSPNLSRFWLMRGLILTLPEPIPIPPHHGSLSEATQPESVEPLQSTSPSSYFTAAGYQSQQASSVASTSIAGSEGALSEAEMAEVTQVNCDNIEVEEHPVTIIPGWTALQQEIIQGIVDSIHANPVFFDHLIRRFPDQDKIFETSVNTWRGLHIVCRRLKAQEIAHQAEEQFPEEDPRGWEEYTHTGGNPPVHREEDLLHTPQRSTVSLSDSLQESIRTNIMHQNNEEGRPIPLVHVTAAEDIDDEYYIAYD